MRIMELDRFDWDMQASKLSATSEIFGGGFPDEFGIRSHHTGLVVVFQHIKPDHPLYDEDGWDGEMAIYQNVTPMLRNMTCVIRHAF